MSINTPVPWGIQLSQKQKEIVEDTKKQILVIGGSGTGKTTVLVEKIKYLQKRGVDIKKILVLTLTNRSKLLIIDKLNPSDKNLNIFNFYKCQENILKKVLSFRPFDKERQKSILLNIIKSLGLNVDLCYAQNSIIECIKNRGKSDIKDVNIAKLYDEYRKYTDRKKMMSFEEIDIKFEDLMSREDFASFLPEYDAIFVDEFQDIKKIHFEFIKKLFHSEKNIFCIGTPQQNIYPGCSKNIFRDFEEHYTGTSIHELTYVYRSTKQIVDEINKLISDDGEPRLSLNSENVGMDVEIYRFKEQQEEYDFTVKEIEEKLGGGWF